MDGSRFDALAKTLSVPDTRRRVLGLLASLPLLGGVGGVLDPDEAEAKDRRRRRKQRHKRRKNPGKRKEQQAKKHKRPKPQPPCQSPSRAQTCADRCGSVTDACGKQVDCGSCDCPAPCGACQICQSEPNTAGTCVPDAAQDGAACDDGDLCATGSTCAAGVCGGGSPVVCPATDCQTPGTCDPATGSCTSPTPRPAGTACGSQPCGTCDGSGACVANAACSGTTPVCDGTGTCVACSVDPEACPGSTCCDGDARTCVASCPPGEPICGPHNRCRVCEAHAECGSNALCVDGACHACDVVAGQNLAMVIGGAEDGETLYVCVGTYAGDITITSNITLIGAGEGPDRTAIRGNVALAIEAGTANQPVTLRGLLIQGSERGILINEGRHLTMRDCIVSGSRGLAGAGIANSGGTLLMTGCIVEHHEAEEAGGGLYNDGGPATLIGCLFQANRAQMGGAIYTVNGGIVTLSGTRVTGNTAFLGGSGIFNHGNDGSTVELLGGSVVCANHPTADQCHGVTETDGRCQVTCPTP